MSSADIARQWLVERDRVIEADDKGQAVASVGRSIAVGSWNGSETDPADLRREASVLRFLLRELDNEAEVDAARAAAGPPPLSREDARAVVLEASGWADWQPARDDADRILDALGWPA